MTHEVKYCSNDEAFQFDDIGYKGLWPEDLLTLANLHLHYEVKRTHWIDLRPRYCPHGAVKRQSATTFVVPAKCSITTLYSEIISPKESWDCQDTYVVRLMRVLWPVITFIGFSVKEPKLLQGPYNCQSVPLYDCIILLRRILKYKINRKWPYPFARAWPPNPKGSHVDISLKCMGESGRVQSRHNSRF